MCHSISSSAPFLFGVLYLDIFCCKKLHACARMASRKATTKGWERQKSRTEAVGKYAEVFQEYCKVIDADNDKYERLVKLSRDCTIHSKRAIFTLHQFSGRDDKVGKSEILSKFEAKIKADILPNLHSIAMETSADGPHKHHRAYSPGLQEFIEALAFYKYLKCGRLISFAEVQNCLTFQKESENTTGVKSDDDKWETDILAESLTSSDENKLLLLLSTSDFILGLADFTGELMRLCINSLGSGNRELPFTILPFFRALSCGFHELGPTRLKCMHQKMSVLRSSLWKVENICYTLKIRGSEIPRHMLMNVINNNPVRDEDMED